MIVKFSVLVVLLQSANKLITFFIFIYFLALYNSLVTVRISSVSLVCIITSSGRKMLHKKIRTTKRFVLNADKTDDIVRLNHWYSLFCKAILGSCPSYLLTYII